MWQKIALSFLLVLVFSLFTIKYKFSGDDPLLISKKIFPQYIPEQNFYTNELLILLNKSAVKNAANILKKYQLKLISPLEEWLHVSLAGKDDDSLFETINSPKGSHFLSLKETLEDDPEIHAVQLNYAQRESSHGFLRANTLPKAKNILNNSPKDPWFKYQWYLGENPGVNAQNAWQITRGNQKNLIAVVDRNFSFSDFDLTRNSCASRKYFYENILSYFPMQRQKRGPDIYPHGTYVLNVLAPCTNNGYGLSAIDWHSQIFAIDSKNDLSFSARLFGVLWASGSDICSEGLVSCPKGLAFQKNLHSADVINASFGFSGDFLKTPPYGPVLDVVGQINRQGKILVASAGNENILADRRLPGALGGVISVGATNRQGQSAQFSNYGRSVDVLAPGEKILGVSHKKAIELNGTSFSAPMVTSVVGLLKSVNENISWKVAEYYLKKSAHPLSCDQYCPKSFKKDSFDQCRKLCCRAEKNICSAGIVDAHKAVLLAQNGLPKTALVDFDDYFIPLSEETGMQKKVLIKNWGLKKALIKYESSDAFLKMFPEQILMNAANAQGQPSTSEVTIFYDAVPNEDRVIRLTLKAANFDQPTKFDDSISAIVDINVDNKNQQKRYMELVSN